MKIGENINKYDKSFIHLPRQYLMNLRKVMSLLGLEELQLRVYAKFIPENLVSKGYDIAGINFTRVDKSVTV